MTPPRGGDFRVKQEPSPNSKIESLPTGEKPNKGSPPESPKFYPPNSPSGNRGRPTPQHLQSLVEGFALDHPPSPFDMMQRRLNQVAHRLPGGSHDATFEIAGRRYHLRQKGENRPLEMGVYRDVSGKDTGPEKTFREAFRITYHPNGNISSTQPGKKGTRASPAQHGAEKMSWPEQTYNRAIQEFLTFQADSLRRSKHTYLRLRKALGDLRGTHDPKDGSLRWDHFVALREPTTRDIRVYSFQVLDSSLRDIEGHPGLNQVKIFETSGSAHRKILNLSGTGEVDFQGERVELKLPEIEKMLLADRLIRQLESAYRNPVSYRATLETRLESLHEKIGRDIFEIPSIARSIEIPETIGPQGGPRGERIFEIKSGWQLWNMIRPFAKKRVWENFEKPGQHHQARPHPAMRRAMVWELTRWTGRTYLHYLFGRFRDPRPSPDKIKLYLHPDGSGQLTVYRKGNPHRILLVREDGTVTNTNQLIKQLGKSDPGFHRLSRTQQVLAAAGKVKSYEAQLLDLPIQQVPPIDFDRIHLRQSGKPMEIRDVQQAWAMIQKIPELQGLPYRLQLENQGMTQYDYGEGSKKLEQIVRVLATNLGPGTNKIEKMGVEYPGSHPPVSMEIREYDLPLGRESKVHRVDIIAKQGEDMHALAFEDGQRAREIAARHLKEMLVEARAGTIQRPRWTSVPQWINRVWGYGRIKSINYAVSHFASVPIVKGVEWLAFSPEERQLIGTPWPQVGGGSILKLIGSYWVMWGSSAMASNIIDAIYNTHFAYREVLQAWRHQGASSLTQVVRHIKPNLFNPEAPVRPISKNFLFRGYFQRTVPLFVGLATIDAFQNGGVDWDHTLHQFRNVAGVSALSGLTLDRIQKSPRWAHWARRKNLLVKAGDDARRARYALTFKGTFWTVLGEFVLLGLADSAERKFDLKNLGQDLRSDLGRRLEKRNRFITRLEQGEAISPGDLLAADLAVQQGVAHYRTYLEMTGHTEGQGNYPKLSLNNAYLEEQQRRERERELSRGEFTSREVETRHRKRWGELPVPNTHLENRLGRLPRPLENPKSPRNSAAEDLARFLNRVTGPAPVPRGDEPTKAYASPIPVESQESKVILEQFQYKAMRDPSFIHWTLERKARYLLDSFPGYRVNEAGGNSRPWRLKEAQAYLIEVQQESLHRIGNGIPSLGPHSQHEGDPRLALKKLTEEIRENHQEASPSKLIAATFSQELAKNIPDLDRQMENYYQWSNRQTEQALEKWLKENETWKKTEKVSIPLGRGPQDPSPVFSSPTQLRNSLERDRKQLFSALLGNPPHKALG